MANCPKCQSEIPDDFGLVTCASCGNQVLINFDGQVTVNEKADGPPAGMAIDPGSNVTSDTAVKRMMDRQHSVVGQLSEQLSVEISQGPPAHLTGDLQELSPIEPEVKRIVTSDMSDVADFANSPMSQAREGSLLFDIYITGVDTADIRQRVKEVLTDIRFVWDADAHFAKLRNGELRLKNISAIKSAIIIQRLRSVPVEVRWEQHAIHQA